MTVSRQKPPRPANMSQLDYLWTYFGGYSVSNEASAIPQDDIILTESALTKLISTSAGGGIVKLIYRNHPTDPSLIQLVGANIDGTEVTVVDMPKEIHVIDFGGSIVTSEDIDSGCPFPIGTNVIKLVLSDGTKYYFNLDKYVIGSGIKGVDTDTITTKVVNGIISSEVKIKPDSNSSIILKSDSSGLYGDIVIKEEDTGIIIDSNNGLSAKIPLKNSQYFIRFQQLTLAEYMNIESKDPGMVYFITDKPYIYLGEKRYGVDINPGEVPIVSLVYDADHMLLSYKKADGSDIQQIYLGPATEKTPGMLSAEDYARFNAFGNALGDITNISDFINEETSKLAISLEYGEPENNQRPLYLKNRKREILSTVWIDVDNYLASSTTREATEQDVEDAASTGVTNINVGDQILIMTLVDGNKVYTNLAKLVINYKFKKTDSITLKELSDHTILADLNLVDNKIVYSSAEGINANLQIARENGFIVVYGKTKTQDCILGRFQSPNMELISGTFIESAEQSFIEELTPDKLDWEDYNEFTNAPVIGDPYYVLVYQEYKDDPFNFNLKTYWISLKPILNQSGIYDLGEFDSSGNAENEAAKDGIFNNINYSLLRYTTKDGNNGIITNSVSGNTTVQKLLLKGEYYLRTIVKEEDNIKISEWEPISTVILTGYSVTGLKLFKLTTESSQDDIKAALTDPITLKLVTLKELNKCFKYGYYLKDSVMGGKVNVGWTGQGFILTEVHSMSPKKDPSVCTITINVTEDGIYSILKDGVSSEIGESNLIWNDV